MGACLPRYTWEFDPAWAFSAAPWVEFAPILLPEARGYTGGPAVLYVGWYAERPQPTQAAAWKVRMVPMPEGRIVPPRGVAQASVVKPVKRAEAIADMPLPALPRPPVLFELIRLAPHLGDTLTGKAVVVGAALDY